MKLETLNEGVGREPRWRTGRGKGMGRHLQGLRKVSFSIIFPLFSRASELPWRAGGSPCFVKKRVI